MRCGKQICAPRYPYPDPVRVPPTSFFFFPLQTPEEGKSSDAKEKNVQEVEVQMQKPFLFLRSDAEYDDVEAAANNLLQNASQLKVAVKSYLQKLNLLDKAGSIVSGLKTVAPVLKTIAVNLGAGAVAESASVISNAVWGDVKGLCDYVVQRGCNDILTTLNSIEDFQKQPGKMLDLKTLILKSFREMHNSLVVEAYTDVTFQSDSLRDYINEELQKPLVHLSGCYAHVLELLKMNEIEMEMKRQAPPAKGEDVNEMKVDDEKAGDGAAQDEQDQDGVKRQASPANKEDVNEIKADGEKTEIPQ
jgi:hypothetical protein